MFSIRIYKTTRQESRGSSVTTAQHNKINLIFTTLWSNIRPAYEWQIEHEISDFRVIKYNGFRFSSAHFNQLHDESLIFLKQELQNKNKDKSVVVTHHVPTFMNYPEKYRGDVLNEAFAVELYDLIEDSGPDFWIFGHHHFNLPDFMIGKTNLATNQLGYVKYGEHKYFRYLASVNL